MVTVDAPPGLSLRAARREDATHMAALIAIAGEGIPELIWRDLAQPGQPPLEVGSQRAARDSGSFSYRNALIAEVGGRVAGWPACCWPTGCRIHRRRRTRSSRRRC